MISTPRGWSWRRPANGALFLELMSDGVMHVDDLITHRFEPEQAEEAYVTAVGEADSRLGVVFTWK